MSALVDWALALAVAVPAADQGAPQLEVVEALESELPLCDQRLADLDGDGRPELVLVARDGRLERRAPGEGRLLAAAGALKLADPEHLLLDFGAFDPGRPGQQLVAASPRGLALWLLADEGAFDPQPRSLSSRG